MIAPILLVSGKVQVWCTTVVHKVLVTVYVQSLSSVGRLLNRASAGGCGMAVMRTVGVTGYVHRWISWHTNQQVRVRVKGAGAGAGEGAGVVLHGWVSQKVVR